VGAAEEAEVVWDRGELGVEENQISAVACDVDGGSSGVMGTSDRTSSSADCGMGGFSTHLGKGW
jgi:hypothetical protein